MMGSPSRSAWPCLRASASPRRCWPRTPPRPAGLAAAAAAAPGRLAAARVGGLRAAPLRGRGRLLVAGLRPHEQREAERRPRGGRVARCAEPAAARRGSASSAPRMSAMIALLCASAPNAKRVRGAFYLPSIYWYVNSINSGSYCIGSRDQPFHSP